MPKLKKAPAEVEKVQPSPILAWERAVKALFGLDDRHLKTESSILCGIGIRMSEHDRRELLAVLTTFKFEEH